MKRLAVLCLLLLPFGHARGADLISWIGTRERVIDGKPIDIPIDFSVSVEANAASVIQVTGGGREINPTAVDAGLLLRNQQRYLRVVPHTAEFARMGTYLVKVRVTAADKMTTSVVELTLTRPAGDLAFGVPLRTERVIYLPFLDCWSPRRWPLAASGTEVTPEAKERTIAFLGSDQKAIGETLTVALPELVPVGQQKDVELKSTANFPLGTSTGKLVIDAPQLTKAFESQVEVVSRVSKWWLLITIALTILLGHYVRTTLERRRLRALARAGADEQLASMNRLSLNTTDEDFREQLQRAITTLEGSAKNEDADLSAAVSVSTAEVARIQKAIADMQAQTEADLAKLRVTIGDPAVQLAMLRTVLEPAAAHIEAAATDLAAGQIRRAAGEAKRLADALLKAVENARLPWTQEVSKAASLAGVWPESPANDRVQKAAADAAAVPGVQTIEEAATFVKTAAVVTGDLRDALYVVVSSAHDLAGRMLAELEPFRSIGKPVVDALDALAKLAEEPLATSVGPLAAQAAALRQQFVVALTSVAPKAADIPSAGEGKFALALAEVLKARQGSGSALGDIARSLVLSGQIAAMKAKPPPIPYGVLPVTLVLEDEVVAGRYARVRLQIDDPRIPASSVVVTWYRDDQQLYTAAPGDLLLRFEAGENASVIRAEASAGDRQGRAWVGVVPHAPLAANPNEWRRRSRLDEWKQTAVAGAFIMVIGYLIFADSFLGTLVQFLAAALWGFTVDISLPKLMAYAAPVAAKTPALP